MIYKLCGDLNNISIRLEFTGITTICIIWLSEVIAYISMSNILKTVAKQTKILPAQTAQTIEPVLGEFGAWMGGVTSEWPMNIILLS